MDAKEPLKMYKMTERDRENFDISIYIVKKNTKIKFRRIKKKQIGS